MRYFDWEKAKAICAEYKGHDISAGMEEDWYWTSDLIFNGEKRVECDPWIGSVWATPVCKVFNDDGSALVIPCYQTEERVKMPDWWAECDAR